MTKKERQYSAEEHLFRCFCNYDRCNSRQNFDANIKAAMLHENDDAGDDD